MSDLAITSDGRLPSLHAAEGERLKQAARQFETTFIAQLMADLELQPIDEEPLFGNDPASRQFTSLYHTALSERSAGGLGISEMIMRELAAKVSIDPSSQSGSAP